jgi:hypothetical protein
MPRDDEEWRFGGFALPSYTQVPDEFFDAVAPRLKEAELRVALYVIRRTFGFKKVADAISLDQLVAGIRTRDGRVLDAGTGMTRKGVIAGIKGLLAKQVLIAEARVDENGGSLPTVYRLHMQGELRPVSPGVTQSNPGGLPKVTPGGLPKVTPGVNDVPGGGYPRSREGVTLGNPQQTDQQTEQETVERSINVNVLRQEASVARYVEDIARELHDQASLAATATRAINLWRESSYSLDEFVGLMLHARRRTQEHSGSIKATDPNGPPGQKAKMGYWFAILEALVRTPRRGSPS